MEDVKIIINSMIKFDDFGVIYWLIFINGALSIAGIILKSKGL